MLQSINIFQNANISPAPLRGISTVKILIIYREGDSACGGFPARSAVVDFFGIKVVVSETVNSDLLPHRSLFAVVAIGVNGNSSAGREFSPDLDILGIHKLDKVFHNDVHAVLVEVPVVAEAVQIKLQGLAFHHSLRRDVGNIHRRKVGLSRNRAKACEFGAVKFHKIVIVLMLVDKGFQHLGGVVCGVFGFLVSEQGHALGLGFGSS